WKNDRYDRRRRQPREARFGAGGVHRGAGGSMRLLHAGHDLGRESAPRAHAEANRCSNQGRARGKSLPLRRAHTDPSRGAARIGATVMKRRQLLKGAGSLVVGFTLRDAFPLLAQQPAGGVLPPALSAVEGRTLDPKEVDSALAIHADGSVTVFTSKVDVGTGMRIAIAQMAAEELGVAASRVTVVDGDTATCPNTGGTGGSTGLTRGGTAVRQAAATARQEILKLAAERLRVTVDRLTIID